MSEPITKPVDFRVLMIQGAREFGDLAKRAEEDLSHYRDMNTELAQWAERADMNQAYITFKPQAGGDPGSLSFEVFIPPFLPSHYEGEAIMGPFGTTYWPTWEEAKDFHDRVIADIWAGKYGVSHGGTVDDPTCEAAGQHVRSTRHTRWECAHVTEVDTDG